MNNKLSYKRLTLGLLAHGAGDPNNRAIWSGVADTAKEYDVNLICYAGKPLQSPHEFEAKANIVYSLVNTQLLDGLIIWLAGIAYQVDRDELRDFCMSYQPLPIVTVGTLVQGIHGVLVDNEHGMREVVAHLLDIHHCQRIAFIRGPEHHQEAEQRFRAFQDELSRHNIPLDERLVVPGNFRESGGVRAIEELLDHRKVTFDALVAASDNMAIGAMKSLQERGIRIPGDLLVAAINDEAQSQLVVPGLTTSPLHFYDQARKATEMILAMLRDEQVPEQVIMPAQLLVRQSCGCPDPVMERAVLKQPVPDFSDSQRSKSDTDQSILAGQQRDVENYASSPDLTKLLADLERDFLAEINGKPDSKFLSAFISAMFQISKREDVVLIWNDLISALRSRVRPNLSSSAQLIQAENLLHQARVLVGEEIKRQQAFQVLLAEEKLRNLGKFNQALSITTERNELAIALEKALRLLNIPRCYLALYEDTQEPSAGARLFMAYDERGIVITPDGPSYPASMLVPESFLDPDLRYHLAVEPLYFQDDQLGFILFEAETENDEIYENLRGTISAGLKRAILTEGNIKLYYEALDAKRAAEEANLHKSRFLSMVSHELRTPLSLIVGTIEMLMREQEDTAPPLPERYQGDIETIHTSAQHLFRLIGDVLDLASSQAGELRLTFEPVNLSGIIEDVARLGKALAREKGLNWQTQIQQPLPVILADRTRLRQVLLNLLSNAVKFTERGMISLTVGIQENKVVITVTDTGMGIPKEDQAIIFDEFRRSERSQARGYGGLGIGLAITRRLVELHGGMIQARSSGEEESGSVFCVSLPIPDKIIQDSQSIEKRARSVLLLVESTAQAPKMRDHLIQRGFEVEVLSISRNPNWLAQVIASPPGAVVLDYHPAAAQGWELMRCLRENPATQEIPVVFYSISEEHERGTLLEMDYLTKPLSRVELLNALQQFGLDPVADQRTILIVDDEPKVLEMHVRMLAKELPGYRLLTAHNGRDAMQAMERSQPDLVLLDLMMPDMDGFEVLAAMRDQKIICHIPVVILTAQKLSYEDMDRLQLGVAAVLGKDLFSEAEVLSQIETALARSGRLGTEAQRIVRKAMVYIHTHFEEDLSRNALAEALCVSDNYLGRCFIKELRLTPITYLNRFRVQQARKRFEKGESNITEVANEVGFSDSNYFGRVFRREVGVSPSAYLRGKRAEDALSRTVS